MNKSDALPNTITSGTVERRTVLKVAAWATPAITLMTATPAFAATSVPLPLLQSVSLTATRGTDNTKKYVYFVWQLKANAAVSITSITFGGAFNITSLGQQSIAAGTTATINFTGANQGANDTSIPAIIITVLLNDGRSATFATPTVNALAEGGTTTVEVTPGTGNPTT